ncbi:probable protein phosphatase 2C 43 [Nymphaea colorata]|nr:probable protein phosphatase 2C 43 [Nymphaea colorata]
MKNFYKNRFKRLVSNDEDKDDPSFWSKTLRPHPLGEFSIAVLQASETMEDHAQVETSRHGTFIGVYDGHVGDDASRFVVEHLFPTFVKFVKEGMSVGDAIRESFSSTDEEFLEMVGRTREAKPLMAATGSCCLVGIVLACGTVYVANAGNSRAVLGGFLDSHIPKDFVVEQLSEDHLASTSDSVKQSPVSPAQLGDPNIVELNTGARGFVQGTRAIGDAYLKKQEFSLPPEYPRFRRPEPLTRPLSTAEPSIRAHSLQPNDRFLIFASSGLWEHLSNQEAAEIVLRNPREGIARRLIRAAIKVAEKKSGVRYAIMKLLGEGGRLACHNDITVVVVYTDHEMIGRASVDTSITGASIRGFIDAETASDFSLLDEVELMK